MRVVTRVCGNDTNCRKPNLLLSLVLMLLSIWTGIETGFAQVREIDGNKKLHDHRWEHWTWWLNAIWCWCLIAGIACLLVFGGMNMSKQSPLKNDEVIRLIQDNEDAFKGGRFAQPRPPTPQPPRPQPENSDKGGTNKTDK